MLIKMKVFFVALILCHLVVTKAMASSRYTRFKNKDADGHDTLALGVNNTGPNHHEYSESGSRRAIVVPTDGCYTQYFIGQKPPTGFRPNSPLIKHICQQIYDYSDDTLYATMFDENIGIAVYVAYGIPHDQVPLIGTFPRIAKWIQNPGIARQGSNQMYQGNTQNIHKGHLVPAETYSFDCIYMVSTFRYTNAVPQYAAFNTGQWSRYEGLVRKFASEVCRLAGGDVYLLTGTSEAVVTTPTNAAKQGLRYFPLNNHNTGNIVIPNSMWTAGCCINQLGVLGGFAAIGNNVQVNPQMHQVTVKQLQNILAIGRGPGTVINLFPGDARCSNDLNQYRYEEGGTHPSWTKAQNLG